MSRLTKIITRKQTQKGFSLVELMISIVLGMIATAGAISMFSNSVRSNGEGLQQIMLNQELRALMDVMARDIRRAGYWRNADGVTFNPFQTLTVPNNNCITYSYDVSGAAAPGNSDNFGFRLIDNTVRIRSNSTTCDLDADWTTISSADVINITALTFTLTQPCFNTTNSARTCATAIAGDVLSNMFVVDIAISGELVSDSDVSLQLTESVTVRNTQAVGI